jgi:hypothetical protein
MAAPMLGAIAPAAVSGALNTADRARQHRCRDEKRGRPWQQPEQQRDRGTGCDDGHGPAADAEPARRPPVAEPPGDLPGRAPR